MNERRPNDLLSAYFDDEVSPQQRIEAERLLGRSAPSRRELDEIGRLSELLRSVPRESAPAELAASVLDRVKREALPVRDQTAHAKSRARAWTAVAATFFTTAAALFALVKVFDRPARDQLAKVEPAALAKDGRRPGAEFGAVGDAKEPERRRIDGMQVVGDDRGEQPSRDKVTPIDQNSPKSAAGRPVAEQTVDLKKMRPGEVIPYFEHVGDRMAWVDVTVIDVRKAFGALEVLLLKNAIRPAAEQSPDAALGEAVPKTDEPTDGLFAVYVVATERQLASTLAVMREQDLFVDLQLKQPVTIDGTTIATLEPRSPQGLVRRYLGAGESNQSQASPEDGESSPLEPLNLRVRQPLAPAVKPDGLADKVESKKPAESRHKLLESPKPGKGSTSGAATNEAQSKTEKEPSQSGTAGGGRSTAVMAREGHMHSYWRFVKLPTGALDFKSRIASAEEVRKDAFASSSPSPSPTAGGKQGAADRAPGRQSQPIRALFVFHARPDKPAATPR